MEIATADKVLIPATRAVKYPIFEANYSDGSSLKLPITTDSNDVSASRTDVPKATLLCLSFHASSQVSFIDSWLLTKDPIKRLLLCAMRKSNPDRADNRLQRQILYSFGDHYYFRKELKILNLLTRYIF